MSGGQTLLVVGGGSGIGAAICQQAQQDGWRVISMDLVACPGNSWEHVHVDLRDPLSITQALQHVRDSSGVIDALHITAGVSDPTPASHMSSERVNEIFRINVVSAIEVVTQLYDTISDGGSIVLFSSIAASRGGGLFSASVYASSKSAIEGLTRGIAREFATRGIRVNCIAPGPTNTPMLMKASDEIIQQVTDATFLGRLCEPAEIAEAALFLSSNRASAITGTTLHVDGGIR